MKKTLNKIAWICRRWYIRHTFEKWYTFYLKKNCKPSVAWTYAESILVMFAPHLFDYEDYLDFLLQEYLGMPDKRRLLDNDKRLPPARHDCLLNPEDFAF